MATGTGKEPKKFKKFECKVVNEKYENIVYIQGTLTVGLQPKDQPKPQA